jgi:L-aspartate oxidase
LARPPAGGTKTRVDYSTFSEVSVKYQTDFLVIGSGIAGLTFARKAAKVGSVALVTKKGSVDANTNYAQGGIAGVFDPDDDPALHVKDTLDSGDGLCHSEVVGTVVREGPPLIRELAEMGVRFNPDPTDPACFDLHLEGGHCRRRVVHAADATGRAVEECLVAEAEHAPGVTIFENHMAVDLITQTKLVSRGLTTTKTKQYCWGAYVLDENSGEVHTFIARVTVLATGGAGMVYLHTTNPDIATGDGPAIAYRAGAAVANMEFVQFHPTTLYHPGANNFLISEAVRGEGARLVDARGRAFMAEYSPQKDLATRDTVARAIDAELKRTGQPCVYLDITHRPADILVSRFPNIHKKLMSFGIDMTARPIPVVPAAHYMCGGVVTDLMGQSTLPGLCAIGEAASTGLHGANRLASNSLLEALVFAHRAAAGAIKGLDEARQRKLPPVPEWNPGGATDIDEAVIIAHNWDEIRRLMWNYVGIVRTDKRLARAARRIKLIQDEINEYYWDFRLTPELLELRNLALVAELIVGCAQRRRESRGLHYNLDHPGRDDAKYRQDTVLTRDNP